MSLIANTFRRLVHEERGWGRVWTGLAMGICLAGGGLVYQQVQSNNSGELTANLWVDASGGSCARSSSPTTYQNNGTECSSIDTAYQDSETSCGDVVGIASSFGTNQSIIERAALSSCSPWIVFKGKDDPSIDKVTLGSSGGGGVASNGPDHIELRDFSTRGIEMTSDVDGVLIDNIDGGAFIIEGGKNVTIQNSDWGPCPSAFLAGPHCTAAIETSQIRLYQDATVRTDNILIKNNVIHDFTRDPGEDDHWECIIASGGDNVTIEGNWFYNCMLYAIAFGDEGTNSNTAGTWIFQNNWFADSESDCDIWDGQQPFDATVLMRYNSFQSQSGQGLGHCGGGAVATNSSAYGNIYGTDDSFFCDDGWTYDYNYFIDRAGSGGCGTHKTVGADPYVNGTNDSSGNYHLSGSDGSTGADNLVVPNTGDYALGYDKDGDTRPQDSTTRDAGSDER